MQYALFVVETLSLLSVTFELKTSSCEMWTYLVDKRCDNSQLGERRRKPLDALRAGDEIQEQYPFLGDSPRLQNLNGHDSRSA